MRAQAHRLVAQQPECGREIQLPEALGAAEPGSLLPEDGGLQASLIGEEPGTEEIAGKRECHPEPVIGSTGWGSPPVGKPLPFETPPDFASLTEPKERLRGQATRSRDQAQSCPQAFKNLICRGPSSSASGRSMLCRS